MEKLAISQQDRSACSEFATPVFDVTEKSNS